MNFKIKYVYNISIVLIVLFHFLSCGKKNETQTNKPWNHKDVLTEKYKYLLNSDNYNDSNYKSNLNLYYETYLASNHADSALFCLLASAEMLDQNYIYDSSFLSTAIKHLKKYEPISTLKGELIKLYYYIGSQYESNSEYELAEDWFNKGIQHPDVLPRTRIKCLGMLSEIYERNNQYEKAIELQHQRLEFYKQENDTINIAVTYSNISGIYNEVQAFGNAKKFIGMAIEFSRLKHDTNTLIPMLSNYFIYEKNAEENFVFTPHHIKILKEMNQICDNYSKLSPYNEWVRQDINFYYYYKQNNLDSMKITLDKIERVVNVINSLSISSKFKFLQSQYQLKKGKFEYNEDEILELAKIYVERELWWEAGHCYLMLLDLTESKGEYKKSLEYLRRLNELVRKRTELNNKGQILDLQIKYETEKKSEELIIQSEKLKRKQRDFLLLALFIIILILGFLVYIFIQKDKINSEKIKTEVRFTQQLMENTEEERKRIAKDLHDSIGHDLLNMKNSIQSNLLYSEKEIDHIISEIREISRNLFPVMFEEIGLQMSLEQLLLTTEKKSGLFISHEIHYVSGTLNSKQELNVYRIIQEAISNTIKYAKAQSGKIIINQENNVIQIDYLDNGIGFNVNEVLKSGKAFGLISMQQRVISLKGEIEFNSNSDGTKIRISIPVNQG